MGTEFTCSDCGHHVFRAIAETPTPDPPPLCFQCQWMRTLDPEDRASIERFLDNTRRQ
jgi:hypothetical protein